MPRRQCGETLDLYDETYSCDKRKRHRKRRHRERLYGADQRGQYDAVVYWWR